MTATLNRRRPVEHGGVLHPALSWGIVLILAGWLVFCHGCHGDDDGELCVPRVSDALQKRSEVPSASAERR